MQFGDVAVVGLQLGDAPVAGVQFGDVAAGGGGDIEFDSFLAAEVVGPLINDEPGGPTGATGGRQIPMSWGTRFRALVPVEVHGLRIWTPRMPPDAGFVGDIVANLCFASVPDGSFEDEFHAEPVDLNSPASAGEWRTYLYTEPFSLLANEEAVVYLQTVSGTGAWGGDYFIAYTEDDPNSRLPQDVFAGGDSRAGLIEAMSGPAVYSWNTTYVPNDVVAGRFYWIDPLVRPA